MHTIAASGRESIGKNNCDPGGFARTKDSHRSACGRPASNVVFGAGVHDYDRKNIGRFHASEYDVFAVAERGASWRPHSAFRWADRIARGIRTIEGRELPGSEWRRAWRT